MPRKPSETGPTDATVSERIRFYRETRGLSVPALSARILDETGVDYGRSVLSKIETGARRASVHDLVSIAAGLQVAVTDLLMPASDDPLELVETSAAAEPIAAGVLWRWLHQQGAGISGSQRTEIVPVDPAAFMSALLAERAVLVEQIQRQLASKGPHA